MRRGGGSEWGKIGRGKGKDPHIEGNCDGGKAVCNELEDRCVAEGRISSDAGKEAGTRGCAAEIKDGDDPLTAGKERACPTPVLRKLASTPGFSQIRTLTVRARLH